MLLPVVLEWASLGGILHLEARGNEIPITSSNMGLSPFLTQWELELGDPEDPPTGTGI